MIFDSIAAVLTTLLGGLFGLIPAYTIPGSVASAGVSFGGWLGFANAYFPVTVLAVVLGTLVGVRVFVFVFRVVVVVWSVVPFKAT